MPANKTPNSKLVLLASLLIPGSGHVWLGLPKRGLQFLFFIVVLIWAANMAMPNASFLLKNIGGIFIYGLCALDAFKIARIRELSD